jgi:DNA polymerase-3 subunit gamma/tau
MSYQVLARKWRPKSFETLVGQEHVVRALRHALGAGRLHHAYLLTGTRGVGKTTIARILAKSLNCEVGVGATPCGVCSTCQEIEAGRFVDLLEVDAATNTRVEEMRQLLENAVYAPTRGRFKVYVIDEVHMLSTSAFNAMLKTLEEPPEHVKFILATTDPQKIPVTVLSRCLQFSLKQMPQASISEHLGRILGEEKVAFESAALDRLARAANGSMRDALSLLDQAIAHGGGEVGLGSVEEMLGVVDSGEAVALLAQALHGDLEATLEGVRAMADRNLSFDSALQEMAGALVQVQIAQLHPAAREGSERQEKEIATLAAQLQPELVQLAYQIVIHGRDELRYAPDPECGFMMVVLRLSAFSAGGRPVPNALGRNGGASKGSGAGATGAVPLAISSDEDPPFRPNAGQMEDCAKLPSSIIPSLEAEDWEGLVAKLGLSGMARELAQHCELEAIADDHFQLRLSPAHKHLQVPAAEERLRKALVTTLGRSITLRIRLAATQGETIAARGERARAELQERAVQSIESDDFVRQVVDVFDAKIIESTIRPLVQERK